MLRTSEQLFVRNAEAGISKHIEEALNRLVHETLTKSQNGIGNRVMGALETFVVHTVEKVVISPEYMGEVLDAVIDSPGFVIPVVVLSRSEERKLETERTGTKKRCRKSVAVRMKIDPGQFR